MAGFAITGKLDNVYTTARLFGLDDIIQWTMNLAGIAAKILLAKNFIAFFTDHFLPRIAHTI